MKKSQAKHMCISELPQDFGALGGLRHALKSSFNYCRKYPVKMALLKKTLVYVHNRIVEWEKSQQPLPVKEEKNDA